MPAACHLQGVVVTVVPSQQVPAEVTVEFSPDGVPVTMEIRHAMQEQC